MPSAHPYWNPSQGQLGFPAVAFPAAKFITMLRIYFACRRRTLIWPSPPKKGINFMVSDHAMPATPPQKKKKTSNFLLSLTVSNLFAFFRSSSALNFSLKNTCPSQHKHPGRLTARTWSHHAWVQMCKIPFPGQGGMYPYVRNFQLPPDQPFRFPQPAGPYNQCFPVLEEHHSSFPHKAVAWWVPPPRRPGVGRDMTSVAENVAETKRVPI